MFSLPSRNSVHESNTSNPNLPSHNRNMPFSISSNIVWQYNQYKGICWMIWGSIVAFNLFFFFIRHSLSFLTSHLISIKSMLHISCQKHSISNGTSHAVNHKMRFYFFKNCSKSFSIVKSLFHKDRLISQAVTQEPETFYISSSRVMTRVQGRNQLPYK